MRIIPGGEVGRNAYGMTVRHIPGDMNAEELLLYLEDSPKAVSLCGSHGRDACMDIAGIEEMDGRTEMSIARNSLYDVLPEYMFHPIDRFDNIPELEKKERFREEMEAQEQEIRNARRFFSPIDLLLLRLKCDVRKAMAMWTRTDAVLENVLSDSLPSAQRDNRFIRQALPLLPSCRNIRGDKTLLTLMLRKILGEEGLNMEPHRRDMAFEDRRPRYECRTGGETGGTYVGCRFDEEVLCYDVHYWPDGECDGSFPDLLGDMEQFRQFIAGWFLSVEDCIVFNIVTDAPPPCLSEDFNYLNHNTNI